MYALAMLCAAIAGSLPSRLTAALLTVVRGDAMLVVLALIAIATVSLVREDDVAIAATVAIATAAYEVVGRGSPGDQPTTTKKQG